MTKNIFISVCTGLLLFFCSVAGMAQDVSNKSYPYEPASKPGIDIPKGEVLNFTFKNSKIFPGTTRRYWIYIPAAYTPETPACLYVCMDGVMFNAPEVFDYLISKHEMPVTIGVFIESGTIMKNDTTVLRFNRTNEFDNLNDRFARFITEEILPDVEKQKATDGRVINISPNGNDHAIAGASSGAICAFTAAWHRPDFFTRIFSCIGTYVGMRGGDQYPVLVRKTEPKPLRIYLQDNNNDTWNPLFGNWFKANIDMEAALNFAGYEVTNIWMEGGHEGKQATAIFPDAMRWLWKGWPQPVKAGWSANDMLKEILIQNEIWQPVKIPFYISGRIAATETGELMVADSLGNGYRMDSAGKLTALANPFPDYKKKRHNHENSTSLEVEAGRVEQDALPLVSVLANGKKYLLVPGREDGEGGFITLANPDGSSRSVDEDKSIGYAIAVSPDKGQLLVSKRRSHWLYSYAIQTDGTLAYKQKVYWLHNLENEETEDITSMEFDDHGNLYVATEAGVQVCDQNGRVRAILDLPGGGITSLCFGGEKFDTLFVVCNGKLYKRKLKVQGVPSWKGAVIPKSQGAG